MIKELSFTVQGAPKGKGRPRLTKAGIAYTPKDTAVYENLVRLAFSQKYPDWEPKDTRVQAFIYAYYPIPKSYSNYKHELANEGYIDPTKKPDADNIAKSILDSLNGIAYRDDAQVTFLEVTKHYADQPRVEVTLLIQEEN